MYINGNPSVANLAHEMGHNLGVLHASSAYCTDATGQQVSVSDTCVYSEYGDPFSVMAKGTHHMRAWHKGQLGFLDAAEAPGGTTATVTESGAFTLVPSEEALPGTIQSLRVPRKRALDGTVLDYYYLEPATARPIRRNLRLMGAEGPHTVELRAYDASGQFGAMGVVVLK